MLPPSLPDNSRGLSTAQLILSILGILLSLLGLVSLVALTVAGPLIPGLDVYQADQMLFTAWIMGLMILLSIPSLVLSIRRLRGSQHERSPRLTFLASSVCLILIPLIGWAVNQTIKQHTSPWWTTPLNILLVLLPIWWFVELGRLGLKGGSRQRLWGISNFSIFLTLPIVILAEIFVLGIGIVLVSLWLIQQPEFMPFIQQIQQQMLIDPLNMPSVSFDYLPLLQKPELIAAVIAGVAVVVPIIEEMLKPLALWILAKRELTPSEGFVAGIVCGASFALLESAFSIGSVTADTWLMTATARAGTGLLHIVTAGLNGWALAASWKDGSWLRIGLVYTLTVIAHGLWNFFALLLGVSQVGNELSFTIDPGLSEISTWGLAGLILLFASVLILANRRLQAKSASAVLPSPLPPPLPPPLYVDQSSKE